MQHTVREARGALIACFEGEVDLEHSPKVREILLDLVKRKCRLFVDLSGVTYIDSSGVASLVEAFQTARKQKTDFALVSVNPAALRVLALARLDKIFTIHESLPEDLDGGS